MIPSEWVMVIIIVMVLAGIGEKWYKTVVFRMVVVLNGGSNSGVKIGNSNGNDGSVKNGRRNGNTKNGSMNGNRMDGSNADSTKNGNNNNAQ